MTNAKDVSEDDLNRSIASLLAVQQDVLDAVHQIVVRVEASRAATNSDAPSHTQMALTTNSAWARQ